MHKIIQIIPCRKKIAKWKHVNKSEEIKEAVSIALFEKPKSTDGIYQPIEYLWLDKVGNIQSEYELFDEGWIGYDFDDSCLEDFFKDKEN